MSVPPIPIRCAARPTIGGLVVPYISVEHADGYVLGAVHTTRMVQCVTERLCQICGQRLGARVVVFATDKDIDAGYTGEPGMHPECAAYSAKACPLVNGRMAHYRANPVNLSAKACPDPGCGCAGWVDSDSDHADTAGKPARPYSAIWIAFAHYIEAVDGDTGRVIGVGLRDVPTLRIRPIERRSA